MTSEEIQSTILSLTGINRIQEDEKDKQRTIDLTAYRPLLLRNTNPSSINNTWMFSNFSPLPAKDTKPFFNPYGLEDGLMRWIIMEPATGITHNLLYSKFKYKVKEPFGTKEILWQLIDNVEEITKTVTTGSLQRRTMRNQAPNTWREFDIDIGEGEIGRASYYVRRYINSIRVPNATVNEIQTLWVDNPDELPEDELKEECKTILQEYVRENYLDGDFDYQDYEYDDHHSEDSEDFNDETDYDRIIEGIIEQ